jgi:xanthine dehydrogenase YagS FAD-binding subunit
MICRRKGKGPCFALKGDNRYHAIIGAKKCYAVCPSDTAIALAALGAEIMVRGPAKSRKVPVEKFFTPMGNSLERGELVTGISIPRPPEGARQVFAKFTERNPIDFAIVSVAAVIGIKDGICENASIVLGGLAPVPYRAKEAEQVLVGRTIDTGAAEESAETAISGARPLSGNAYKVDVARTMVKRAILHKGQP